MSKVYNFAEEQGAVLEAVKNRNKSMDKRLEALLLRVKNVKREKVAEKNDQIDV